MYNSLQSRGLEQAPPLSVLHHWVQDEQKFVETLSARQRNARENSIQLCPSLLKTTSMTENC